MTKMSAFIASLLAITATPAPAAPIDPTAVLLDRCLQDPANSSTTGQTSCERQAARRYDHRLNAAYGALLKALAPAPAQRLKEAQRAWLRFRAADTSARTALYRTRQGTMYIPMQAHSATVMLRDRALQLEGYLRVMKVGE